MDNFWGTGSRFSRKRLGLFVLVLGFALAMWSFAGPQPAQFARSTLTSSSVAPGAWTIVNSPNPSSLYNFLMKVACTSSNNCWAVGYYWNGSSDQALIEHYDGTNWSVVASPPPPTGGSSFLYGVTCLSANACWAVGSYSITSTAAIGFGNFPIGGQPLVEFYDGTKWSVAISSVAPSPYAGLRSVSCISSNDCWAVGSYGVEVAETLIEHYDGVAWSLASSPNPSALTNALSDVTCLPSGHCWAVGQFFNMTPASCPNGATVSTETLVEYYDGATWSVADAPYDACRYNVLEKMECLNSADCRAVGTQSTDTSTQSTLTQRYDGTSWSIVDSPNASPTLVNHLYGISCANSNDCWTVGLQDNGSSYQPIIEHYDGNGWSIVASPLIAAQEFSDVACVNSYDCWAVGTDFQGHTLIENYAAAAPSATPVPSPTIVASTYLGGSGGPGDYDITWQCATDTNGNVYIAGDTDVADFPVTTNAFQKIYGAGGQDGFIAKFDKNGKLLWSTFLGGTSWDGVYGLAVDAAGNAVVTGVTESSDFPITANAVQNTLSGDAAFVTVISADGTQVLYSTFLGGTQSDGGVPLPTNPFHALPNANVETIGVGIAVGPDGTLYVVGETNTIDMPITSGAAQSLIGGEVDGFIARIDLTKSGRSGLIYSTYLGGALGDFCSAVAVDSSGNAFVTGETQSPNFPTTLGAFQRVYARGTDAFVTKIDPTGSNLIYSTLISGTQGSSASGGTNYNAPSAIVVDSSGHAFIDGETNATDFPTTPGVVQPAFAGQDDGFVTEFSPDGSSLVFSTYLGASDYEGLFGLKVDATGNIFVDGYTSSSDLPLVRPFQSNFGGFIDAWVAELSPGGTALLFSSYLGGSDQESNYGLDLWNGQIYTSGRTASSDFPVTNGAPQKLYGGGVWDNFLTIINPSPLSLLSAVSRKVHGSAGTFDVDLAAADECRSGGANGDYTIVFTFPNDLTNVQNVSISGVGSVATAQIDSNDARNFVVNLTRVGNAQTIVVNLSNVTDSAGNFGSGVSAQMRLLIGDTTGNGAVNSSDIAQTQSQSGKAVSTANFREDVTANGEINSSDIALVQTKSGTALNQPSTASISNATKQKARTTNGRSLR